MKTKTTILKASVLFITAAIMISVPAGMAKTTTPTPSAIRSSNENTQQPLTKDVVWDNDLGYTGLYAAQYEPTFLELGTCADDFEFAEETEVNDVHWIGGYWNGPPDDGDFDWEITFYDDDGTGTSPGAIIAGPFLYPNAETSETFIEGSPGGSNFYSYDVILDPPIIFQGGVKYWISFQAKGVFPPQSGVGAHQTPIQLHEMKFKSTYFGYLTWVDGFDVFAVSVDIAFQLTFSPPAAPELEIESIAGGFGVSAAIKNIGDAEATNVTYTIALEGGLIILGKETTNSIPTIAAGASEAIKAGFILGIGKTTITISASCDEGATASATATGTVLLFFVLGVA